METPKENGETEFVHHLDNSNELKQLFLQQREFVNHFFDNLDYEMATRIIDHIAHSKGLTVTTGIGKSGSVASLFSDFLVSMGIRSRFLSPVNALHGDIAIVNKDDVFVMLSRSGETDELRLLVPYVRSRGATLVALVSVKDSFLWRASDFAIELPVKKELCPFNMAPTTSTVLQLLFSTTLSVMAMKKSGISVEEYACNHPGGSIGKRLTLRAKDVLIPLEHIPSCLTPTTHLKEALASMSFCGCAIAVDEEGKLSGILTDGDLRRALATSEDIAHLLQTELQHLTKKPRVCHADELAWEVMKLMQRLKIHQMPIVDNNNKLQGIILLRELVKLGL